MISGKRLDRDEAQQFWDLDLLTLGAAADQVRRRLNPGNRVTFVIDRNIELHQHLHLRLPLLRLSGLPGPTTATSSLGTNWRPKLMELKDHGGSGVPAPGRPQSGATPGLLSRTREFHPGLRPGGPRLLPAGDFYMAENNALSLEELIRRLMGAGLSSIPGGGAEILVDRVRQRISPQNARPPSGWRSWPRPTAPV